MMNYIFREHFNVVDQNVFKKEFHFRP